MILGNNLVVLPKEEHKHSLICHRHLGVSLLPLSKLMKFVTFDYYQPIHYVYLTLNFVCR